MFFFVFLSHLTDKNQIYQLKLHCVICSFGQQTWNTTAIFAGDIKFTVPFTSFHQTFIYSTILSGVRR